MENYNHKPVYRDTGFKFSDIETMQKAFQQEADLPWQPETYIYTRYRNPTIVETEKKLAKLDNSNWALLTSSGMSAIDLALSIFHNGKNTGAWLFLSELYGGTNTYIETVLKKHRGINTLRFDAENGIYNLHKLDIILNVYRPELIYFETISNPTLIVPNIPEIIRIAKARNIFVVIDNTVATPFLWKPLTDGADIAINSATKYLSGTGTITAGVVTGNNAEWLKLALEYRKLTGIGLNPDDASRLGDALKSFAVRFHTQCENALKIATFLEKNEKIEKVNYPGLSRNAGYEDAMKLFMGKGFGGLVTFTLKGKDQEEKELHCKQFIEKLAGKIPIVPSFGDAETTLMPVNPVWGDKYPDKGMIRLSVGIENHEDLIDLIDKALRKTK